MRSLIDVTYYLYFSALEIMARTSAQDYDTPVAQVASRFLDGLGFDVAQDDSRRRHHSIQTYTHLRNALFHNGKFEATFNENNCTVTLSLGDYYSQLRQIVADAILRVAGCEYDHINWNRWIDRMPWC